jgi:hypothetical protein
MSEVRVNILDACHEIHGTIHGSEIDALVASLSASPATIEELQNALARFLKPVDGTKPFALLHTGINEEPYDAGIVFVDLVARVMAIESSWSNPETHGYIFYHDGKKLTNVRVSYNVPDDWILLNSIAEYKCLCDIRRAQNAASPPLDARAVLYGALTDYIVRECLAARDFDIEDPIAAIHAQWLMTPRQDLRGQSPRTVMLLQRDFIEADLESREHQWSRLGEPAPCLNPESSAYRFAGFGTHEIVVYFDLVRCLISKCWKQVSRKKDISLPDEVARLDRIKSDWLNRPEKDFEDKSPAYIIECERKRLPLAAAAERAMFDDDCPLCRAMAGHAGPTFWHFDGSNMDDDFPFSFYLTRDEWEAEQELQGKFDEELEKEQQQREAQLFNETSQHARNHTLIH